MTIGIMSNGVAHMGSPGQLARTLERDLYRRGLQPGERYLSTRKVQELHGVSMSTAKLAMQQLVKKEMLVRRGRSGTFAGPKLGNRRVSRIKTIHVLIPAERCDHIGFSYEQLLQELRRKNPGTNVQFCFLPSQDDLAYLEETFGAEGPGRAEQLAGVIAVSCSREVYDFLDKQGVPLVIVGTPDADQQHLPSVDVDHFESGRLLATYLLERGHEQLALLTPSSDRPGDHNFLDGIAEALTHAGRPPNALVVRHCLNHPDLVRAQVRSLLQRDPKPTGVICRHETMLKHCVATLREADLDLPRDAEVVFDGVANGTDDSALPFTHVRKQLPYDKIADLLHKLSEGAIVQADRVVSPVELVDLQTAEATAC